MYKRIAPQTVTPVYLEHVKYKKQVLTNVRIMIRNAMEATLRVFVQGVRLSPSS